MMANYEITSISRVEAKTLRKQIQEKGAEADKAWFELCGLLHKIYYSGVKGGPDGDIEDLHIIWGFESWHDYVEQELGLHDTTSTAMVRVAHFFLERMDGAWAGQIISRQKMKALAGHPHMVTKDNVNEWIRKAIAPGMSVCQLERDLGGHQHAKKRNMNFSLRPSDASALSKVIDTAMETGEFATRGDALMSFVRPRKSLKAA